MLLPRRYGAAEPDPGAERAERRPADTVQPQDGGTVTGGTDGHVGVEHREGVPGSAGRFAAEHDRAVQEEGQAWGHHQHAEEVEGLRRGGSAPITELRSASISAW